MTNGEMIQKVFTCEVCEPIPEDDIIHVIFSDKNNSAIGFDLSWWNMEYKEPKTGHWTYDRANVRCSNCGKGYKDAFGRTSASTYNYCPNCGARMIEPQESEET